MNRLLALGACWLLLGISGDLCAQPSPDHAAPKIEIVWNEPPPPEPPPMHPALKIGAASIAMVSLLMLATAGKWLRRNPVRLAVAVMVPCTAFITLGMGMIGREPDDRFDEREESSIEPRESTIVPSIQKHFEPFQKRLQLRSDDKYLYVGSNGLPDHPMMIGIRAWQQQVPIPQPYTGPNAWAIPLHPKLAAKPISAKKALYRGAIALAVNGVPIFNALNNRGEDAYLAGELDEYGGHCGRGDDYHYHIAPVHLEKIVGPGNPIAYALDGFPLYGYTDATGKEPTDLDEFNGRMEPDGYRYYSTKKYPYINGGMRGEVTVRGDQIEPQPRDSPIRPAGQPLRGAKITDFTRDDVKKTFSLKYEVRGMTHSIRYTMPTDTTFQFVYTDANGRETTETYQRRERKGPPKK